MSAATDYETKARLERIAKVPEHALPKRDLPVTDEDREEAQRLFGTKRRANGIDVREEIDWSGRPIISKHDDELARLLSRPYPEGLGDRLRYDHARGRWLIWNGTRWAPDTTKNRHNLLRGRREDYAVQAQTKDELVAVAYLLDIRKQEAVFTALSTMDPVRATGMEFDLNPNLMGVRNGQIDLRTKTLASGVPADLITMSANATYHPDRDLAMAAPRFRKFLSEITGNNPALADYVLLIVGASLFGHVEPQQFYVLVGGGNNGKGVFSNVLAFVLGDYAIAPSRMLYMRSRHGEANSSAARPDLLNLKGRRFAHMSEPSGGSFNEDLLKEHTGNDLITARDLYAGVGGTITFPPTHTIFFRTNNPPKLEDVGVSMARRLRAIPFRQDFSANPDFSLEQALKGEADDILAILIDAAYRYAQKPEAINDLPQDVKDASAEYLEDSDPLSAFIRDRCDVQAGVVASFAELQTAYGEWTADQHDLDLVPMNKTRLGLALGNRFQKQMITNRIHYRGLTLRANPQAEPWWEDQKGD